MPHEIMLPEDVVFLQIDSKDVVFCEQKYASYPLDENNYRQYMAVLSPQYVPMSRKRCFNEPYNFIEHLQWLVNFIKPREGTEVLDQRATFSAAVKVLATHKKLPAMDVAEPNQLLFSVDINIQALQKTNRLDQLSGAVSHFVLDNIIAGFPLKSEKYKFAEFGRINEKYPGYYNSPEGQAFLNSHSLYLKFYSNIALYMRYAKKIAAKHGEDVNTVGSYYVYSVNQMVGMGVHGFARENDLPLLALNKSMGKEAIQGKIYSISLSDQLLENTYSICPATNLGDMLNYFNLRQLWHFQRWGCPLINREGTIKVCEFIEGFYKKTAELTSISP